MRRVEPLHRSLVGAEPSEAEDVVTASVQDTTPLDASSGVFAHLSDDEKLFAVAFSLSGDPAPNQHPANISEDGADVWNALLKSKRYLDASAGKKPVQKWAICTRMFLDLCHRKGVTPFRTPGRKPLTLKRMQEEYSTAFIAASKLGIHLVDSLQDNDLAAHVRGSRDWAFAGVEYRNKRFVIVLESNLRGAQPTAVSLLRYLKREQHFEKTAGIPGVNHDVTPLICIRVRTLKFPTVTMQMRVTFTKDKLLALGIESNNNGRMLEDFAVVAEAWSRRHVFKTLSTLKHKQVRT